MNIRVKQIDQQELSNFVASISTGNDFSTALTNYFSSNGWLGNNVLYITGTDQSITGLKTFITAPLVPTGNTNINSAASKLYVIDHVSGIVFNFSGYATETFVEANGANTFTNTNTFSSDIIVPRAQSTGSAVNLTDLRLTSGFLKSGIDSLQIFGTVYTYGQQNITGLKVFSNGLNSIDPTNPSGVVTVNYLTGSGMNFSNVVRTTGNQEIQGIKTFLQSPVVPIGLQSNNPVRKSQLDAAITNLAVGTGSIQGVTNVNGISGSVLVDGSNGISVLICSGILVVSGNAQNTNLYSVSIPLASGITGINFSYNYQYSAEPNVVGTLKYAGQNALHFIDDVIINSNTGGFNVAFSSGIPSTGYFYNFTAIPVSGQSGFLGIQGERGYPATNFNPRGRWQAGILYTPYDVVFTTPNFVSYWTTQTAISDSFNAPSGSGTSLWQILSSGMQGPTGYFIYQGVYNSGSIYGFKDTVFYDGSTYVYSGINPISGVSPESLTGGWGMVAAKAPIGYFINSGTITGNFTNLSFFVSPVVSGLDLAESFVTRSFYFTGFALGCVTSGKGPENGGILSGRIYVRDTGNNKTIINNFSFNSGTHFFRSGDFSQIITGDNRIGIDITNSLSGIDKFSIGIYGFGT